MNIGFIDCLEIGELFCRVDIVKTYNLLHLTIINKYLLAAMYLGHLIKLRRLPRIWALCFHLNYQ